MTLFLLRTKSDNYFKFIKQILFVQLIGNLNREVYFFSVQIPAYIDYNNNCNILRDV